MENNHQTSRRDFLKKTALGTAGLAMSMSASSYARIIGSN
ncbi:twin-arginine translocation signal domain-containing protein, partial [Xanthocytophaga agilis]